MRKMTRKQIREFAQMVHSRTWSSAATPQPMSVETIEAGILAGSIRVNGETVEVEDDAN